MDNKDTIINIDRSPLMQETVSIRHILSILFRHKYKIVTFFCLVFIPVTVLTFLMPEIFQAKAKVLIKVGRENLSMDPGVTGPTVSLTQSRESDVNSEVAILRSRQVFEKVVDSIGPERFFPDKEGRSPVSVVKAALGDWKYPFLDPIRAYLAKLEEKKDETTLRNMALKDMDRHVGVSNEKNSHIINISYEHQDPRFAEEVLDVLLKFFLAHHISVHSTQTSSKFFDEKSQEILGQLNEKESEYQEFCTTQGISSMERQKDLLLTQISGLRSDINSAGSRISASRAKIEYLKNNIDKSPSRLVLSEVTGKANPAADEIKTRLVELRLKEADMAGKYPDDYRLLQDVRKQIELMDSALLQEETKNTETTTGVNTNYMTLQLDLEREKAALREFKAQKATLTSDLADLEKRLSNLVSHETTLAHMRREMDILQNKYLNYRDKYQQAFTSEALDINNVSNVSVVQSSAVSFDPIKPNKMVNIALGLMLGLFGGVCLAFIWDYFDDTIKTRDDVEKNLKLPVLASVSCKEFRSCI